MGHHHTCCNKQKVKRGLWSPEEDEKLMNYISTYGHGCWSTVPKLAGLQRCGKSCRLRWINYLRPDLKRGSFSHHEAALIIELHRILGNRWAQIAKHLPGRTDNEVKNFWNSSIKKRLISSHRDHVITNAFSGPNSSSSSSSGSSENSYFLSPNSNLIIANPQMDQIICTPDLPAPPQQGFDPFQSDQILNFQANILAPISALSYLPNWPNAAHNENSIFNLDNIPNQIVIGNDQTLIAKPQIQPYDQDSAVANPSILPTLNPTDEGIEYFMPFSSVTQEHLQEEISGFSSISSNIETGIAPAPPPIPLDYIESLMAQFGSSSPVSATSASPPPPPSASLPPLRPYNSPSIWIPQQ